MSRAHRMWSLGACAAMFVLSAQVGAQAPAPPAAIAEPPPSATGTAAGAPPPTAAPGVTPVERAAGDAAPTPVEAGGTGESVATGAQSETLPADGPSTAELAAQLEEMRARLDELEAQAVLGELESDDRDPALALDEPTIDIYGFMDFGFDRIFLPGNEDDDLGILRPTSESTFVFGNLNVYFDATIDPQWRSLFELRITAAPHGEEIGLGAPLGEGYERIDSTAFDFASPSAQSQLRLGSVFVERAWTEWRPAEWLRLRAGVFLNPFGIWTVDHGSPTLIALALPTFVAGQMMPGRLTGVQWIGTHTWGERRLSYYLHVSNGRTPLEFDLTDDKGLGGRVTLGWDWDDADLVLGASTYHGTYDDQEKVIDLVAATTDGLEGFFDWKTTVHFREHVWGADVSLDVGEFRLRAEGVARWVYYEEGKRQPVFNPLGEAAFTPDRLELDAYLLAAYRTPVRLEPYVMMEFASKSFVLPRFAGNARDSANDAAILAPSVGLNYRVTPRIQLKSQVQLLSLYGREEWNHQWDVFVLYTRLVSSF